MKRAIKHKEQEAKRAALYCRVSTVEQGKADFSSLDAQEEMLRKECEAKGWTVSKVYIDTKSGKTLERPELIKLIQDAQEKKFDVVIATKLDRLSRSVKDFLELDEQLAKQGIDIVITTQHIDTTTPAGQMQRTIMMAFAQFEREMIAERTRESSYVRAQKGFWLGGNVPLGYNVVDKKLVVNENEASLVRKIFGMYLENPSTKAVARTLNSEGHRTKARTTRAGKKVGGKQFNYQLVHDILRNRIYTGFIKVNNEVFNGLHDAIVDDIIFDRVQKRLDQSSVDTFATYEGSPLLLLGTTKCGYCGANLTTYFASNGKDDVKHYYYKCTTVAKHGAHKCQSRLVPAMDLEAFAQNLMLHTAKDHGFFDAVTLQIRDNSDEEIAQLDEDRKKLAGNLSAIGKKAENIIENFTESVLDDATKKRLQTKLNELEKQKSGIQDRISKLDGQMDEIKGKKFDKRALARVLAEFEMLYREAPIEQRRQMLRTVISEIRVSAKRGDIEGSVEFKLRGNGTIVRKWNEVVNKRGVYSTPRVGWLRE